MHILMSQRRRGKSNKKMHPAVRGAKVVHQHFWDHFIPHEGNDHVPHVLKHRALLGYSVVILLLKVLVVVTPIMLPSASLYSSAVTASNVILLTNQTRTNLGLAGLTQNASLMVAARAKAQDMLANQYFAHNSPAGLSPWYFIKGQGYAYERAGENLAVHYTTAEGVHSGWLASPAHRANIVKDEFTEIGVGVVNGEFEGSASTIVVQFFGRPKGAITPQLESETEVVVDPEPETVKEPEPVKEDKVEEVTEVAVVDLSNDDNSEEGLKIKEQKIEETPVVDVSKLVIAPTEKDGVYEVKIAANDAKSVAVQMGPDWVDLELNEAEGVWMGEVAGVDTYNKAGETMQVIATDENGEVTAQTAAIVAPNVTVQDFFIFSEGRSKAIKVFGFLTLDNLDDNVKKFYVYFMIALVAAVMLKMLVKIHIQRVSVVAHAGFVLAFAMVMFLL